MTRYAKLGTLSIRWMAVAFFVLAFLSLFVGFAGPWTMGSMMGSDLQTVPGGFGHMMQGGVAMWWGPTLLNLIVGVLLYTMSRPLGTMIGSGLED